MTTAAAPRTAAPVQLTTPPAVYAFGTYCSRRLRGADKEIVIAATKNEINRAALPNMNRIAGSEGLKEGAMEERLPVVDVDIGIMGGADCGP